MIHHLSDIEYYIVIVVNSNIIVYRPLECFANHVDLNRFQMTELAICILVGYSAELNVLTPTT